MSPPCTEDAILKSAVLTACPGLKTSGSGCHRMSVTTQSPNIGHRTEECPSRTHRLITLRKRRIFDKPLHVTHRSYSTDQQRWRTKLFNGCCGVKLNAENPRLAAAKYRPHDGANDGSMQHKKDPVADTHDDVCLERDADRIGPMSAHGYFVAQARAKRKEDEAATQARP